MIITELLLKPHIRDVSSWWDNLGLDGGDPRPSEVLDVLAIVSRLALSPLLATNHGSARFYNSVESYAFSEQPAKVSIGRGQIKILHWPDGEGRFIDSSTSDEVEGTRSIWIQPVKISICVGHSVEMPMALAARSADVPLMWWAAVKANSRLYNEHGAYLLKQAIGFDRPRFGSIPFIGGEPVGWQSQATLTLDYNMPNWIYGQVDTGV